jgi:hypothetical protein
VARIVGHSHTWQLVSGHRSGRIVKSRQGIDQIWVLLLKNTVWAGEPDGTQSGLSACEMDRSASHNRSSIELRQPFVGQYMALKAF